MRSGTNTLARTLIQQQKGQLLLLMPVTSISADGSSMPTLRGDRNPPVSKRYCWMTHFGVRIYVTSISTERLRNSLRILQRCKGRRVGQSWREMAILGSEREINLGVRVKRWQDAAELRVTRCLGQGLEDWGWQLCAGRAKKLELNFLSLCPDPGRQPGFAAMGRKHSALSPAPLPSLWSTQAATGE